MNRRAFLSVMSRALSVGAAACAAPQIIGRSRVAAAAQTSTSGRKPNVLFIAIDDLNDWVGCMEGYPGVKTPNIDRLAERGMLFTNAHCAAPLCNPSRTALMLGLLPTTTGVYNNPHWWKPALPDAVPIPEHFKLNGYRTDGCGKLFHHGKGYNPPDSWHSYLDWIRDDPPPGQFPLNGVERGPRFYKCDDWGLPGIPESEYGDVITVDWAVETLRKQQEGPFFLGVGIFHPHMPWYVPESYLDPYPIESIKFPPAPADDLDDVPEVGRRIAGNRMDEMKRVKAAGKWDEVPQYYLSSVTFADKQVGRLLDALDTSPYAENTIIVLWSDHGWHFGEKGHWHKATLWERATRVPFIAVAPGVTTPGTTCHRAVSLIDIYPTLIDLCGLPKRNELDGQSLVPLLKNPELPWERPALTTYNMGNHAVRSEHWRYIRYHDGGEELYDHRSDPHEWTNLAGNPEYQAIKKELARWIPKHEAPVVPLQSYYNFDEKTFQWTVKKPRQ